MESCNVCRPIILYNDFLPPDVEPHENWDYLAFGYFDGISIGENLFKENYTSLETLWEYDLSLTEELRGGYSGQILYGFRYEERSDTSDEKFWEEALEENTTYPFVFVTLLQGKAEQEQGTRKRRQMLEQELTVENKRKAITYLTLDASSLILVLICQEYEDGATLIDSFHRQEATSPLKDIGIELSYSFSIAAIQKNFLNHDANLVKLQNAAISHVYIYAIEKEPGSIEYIRTSIEKDLGRTVEKESILGCNDEVIIVNEVSWPVFLKWFQDRNGILNHSGPVYRNHLIGITTIIGQRQEPDFLLEPGKEDTPSDRSFITGLKNMMKEIRLGQRPGYRNLERYLHQIINALSKFENSLIPDYIFCSMFLPIRLVLQIIKERSEPVKFDREFSGCFYEFVKALNLCVQNSVRSDRQFIQSLDFNIHIYGTPIRLIAFYNAFIYNTKKFLNAMGDTSEGREYEFLTCSGVGDIVKVNELFKNMLNNNRLFLVSIPENQTYDIKLMLIMLGHEVGHFVGRTVRNREERRRCAVKITVRIVDIYFKSRLSKYKKYGEKGRLRFMQEEDDDYWEQFEKRLEIHLLEQMENLKDANYLKNYKFHDESDEVIENFCSMYKKYELYTHLLQVVLVDGVSDMLREHRGSLFNFLLEKEYLYCLKEGEDVSQAARQRQALSEELGNIVKDLTGYSVWNKRNLSMISAIDMMMSLFKECEADLIAILTLELSLEDYLYAIWKNINAQGVNSKEIPAEVIIRTSQVVCCMKYREGRETEDFCWDDREQERIEANADDQIKILNVHIVNFIDQFEAAAANSDIQTVKLTADVFLDKQILKLLLKYLLTCRSTFCSALADEKNNMNESRMQQQLRDIYRHCQEKNVEEVVRVIQKYTDNYKKQLQEEIEKYGKEMAGTEYDQAR